MVRASSSSSSAPPPPPTPSERDQGSSRANTMSRKWDRFGAETVPLWVADMDFSAPERVVDAVREVAESGHYGYADPCERTVRCVRERLATAHGFGEEAGAGTDCVRWLPGLNPGLNHAVRAVRRMRGGSEKMTTVCCTPIYPPFLYASRNNETPKIEVPLTRAPAAADGANVVRYEVDWDALEAALAKPEVGLLLWCNPHNPVGRVWTRDEMVRVAKTCVKHDVVLVSDEVWRELILDEDKTPFTGAGSLLKEVDGLRERLVVMTSPSKTYNVAGCDVAVACIPDKALRLHFARSGSDKAEITPFGYAALLAAYTDPSCEEWRQRLLAYLRANRDHIHETLSNDVNARELMTWTLPEASYLMWLNCERLVDGVERSPFEHFLEHGVALSDGAPFSAPLSARVNYATRRDILDVGLTRMGTALDVAAMSARDRSRG